MTSHLNLPKIEEEIQKYWEEENIYREVVESKKGGKKFYFCQGPPFTSGHAHIGHAWNHSIKDAYLRFLTFQGYDVFRRAGWDMHGLPIEVKVEEEVLGTRTKKEIEEYGISNFIAECKKFAIKNMHRMTSQLKRLGVWLDWDDPYMTIDKRYIEGVWFCIKKAYEKGLLYEANRVIHWCPRCETALSGYEVRDEYRDISDPSIYVKAKLRSSDESIVIWTTTPWTLPANVAIAVHPDFTYVKILLKENNEKLILAKETLDKLFSKHEYEILEEFKGKKLENLRYEPILEIPIQQNLSHKIVMAPDLVSIEEGTGCVHIAPGHGEEDFEIGKKYNLEVLSPVDDSGRFVVEPFKGMYVRDANAVIIEMLKKSGKLLRHEKIVHSYPHCWRCKTPLIQRTTTQWFLAVSKIRDKLLEKNKEVEWIPEWIGSGRFENWLKNAKDWCISRQRYWNTPLPVWKCKCGHIEVIGSLHELEAKAVNRIDISSLDLHRPDIDRVKLKCRKCKGEMSRVPDVVDVWLDSGSASWANLGYPSSDLLFNELFPPDFITEGSDQTRGWFYSLLVCSVIALDSIAYKKVLYHGFTLDAHGRKMSKSLGNVIDPEDVINQYGADVLRFYMLWASVPWEDLRFSWDGVKTISRLFDILWNVYNFAERYMALDNYQHDEKRKVKLELEDKWLLSRLNSLIKSVTENYERIYLFNVTREIYDFILEDLSRWYIKLVRDRVWLEGSDERKLSVYFTLYETLTKLFVLMAPIAPHLSEYLYRKMTKNRSVHLASWPLANEALISETLEEQMKLVREITEKVIAARQKAKIKLRWPISRVIIASDTNLNLEDFEPIILKMCNAKKISYEKVEEKLVIKPNFKTLGPKAKDKIKLIFKEISAIKPEKIQEILEKDGKIEIAGVVITKEDLIFKKEIPEHLVAEEFSKGVIYIDSKLDSKLISEAMSREIIRRIQEMRKELNLHETQKIKAFVQCSSEFRGYILENKEFIEKETRSCIEFGEGGDFIKDWQINSEKVRIGIQVPF